MKISKDSKIISEDKEQVGFTLVELVVVLAGLSALLAFSLPAFLNTLKLNRIEEAKALMNSYAAECLGKLRIATEIQTFRDEARPDTIDNEKLLTLGYKIDGLGSEQEKSLCSFTRIIPADKEEQFLFAFSFKVSTAGIQKRGTPSNDPKALNSCKGWAGQLCGLSPEQEAYFAELERLQIAEENCEKDYKKKLVSGFIGQTSRWDSVEKKCIQPVCLYKGEVVSCNGGIEKARERELGEECTEWAKNQKSKNNFTYISPASGETTVACGDQRFWFHTGSEWNEPDKWYEKACEYNYQKDRLKTEGEYKYNPVKSEGGPKPCGDKIWICDGNQVEYSEYKDTCGAAPPPPPPPPPPPTCTPFPKPPICNNAMLKWAYKECQCWNRR